MSAVYLIDYGFAVPVPTSATAKATNFCGTPDYASASAMVAAGPYGCRDDLEALVYTLLDFALCGKLSETINQQLAPSWLLQPASKSINALNLTLQALLDFALCSAHARVCEAPAWQVGTCQAACA